MRHMSDFSSCAQNWCIKKKNKLNRPYILQYSYDKIVIYRQYNELFIFFPL